MAAVTSLVICSISAGSSLRRSTLAAAETGIAFTLVPPSIRPKLKVDRGRLFFPNLNPDKKGAEKEGAYRGHRPPILDALMWTYHELEALTREGGPAADDSAAYIDECRRLLVSELQAYLDPRRKDEIVERYDDQDGDDRGDAIAKSKALRTKLETRRPDFKFGADAAQPTRLQ